MMEKTQKNEKRIFGRTRLWEGLNQLLLEEVCQKYRYRSGDMETLGRVAADLKICIKDQERFYCLLPERMTETGEPCRALILLTLGNGPDMLLERYCSSDRLLEAYMADNIAGELLLRGYGQVHALIAEQTGYFVTAMHFYGSTQELPLNAMPEALEKLRVRAITCTSDSCLVPSKTVLYQAGLSATQKQESCAKPCEGCSRRGDCVSRG